MMEDGSKTMMKIGDAKDMSGMIRQQPAGLQPDQHGIRLIAVHDHHHVVAGAAQCLAGIVFEPGDIDHMRGLPFKMEISKGMMVRR